METPFSYAIRNQNAMHLLTFIVIDWDGPTILDIFSRKIYRDIVTESLKFYQKEPILDTIVPPLLNPLAKNGYDIDVGLW